MAFDAFIKISDIPGDCTDEKHKDWIQIKSFRWGGTQPITLGSGVGGLSGGGVNLRHFSFVAGLDGSHPKLHDALCKGTSIPKVEIELRKSTGEKTVYQKYIFENAMISSHDVQADTRGDDDIPIMETSIAFAKFENTHTPLDDKQK